MSGEWLEALDLRPRPPDLDFLRRIFRAFNEKIPFESASKIVRDREVADPGQKPRRPGLFWADFLEKGAGGTCFARTAALEALLRELEFPLRRVIARIGSPANHAALAVALEGREWLVDVGYPLPEIFAFERGERETSVGVLRMTVEADGATLLFASGPDRGRSIRFELESPSDEEFELAWRRTFARPSMFLSDVVLRREREGRVVRFHRGEVQVSDAASRTRIPFRSGRAQKLSEIFEIDGALLERALELAGDPEPALEAARIEVFREGEDAQKVFDGLAAPGGYRKFVEGLGSVEIRSTGDRSFEATITADRGEPVVETIRVDREKKLLTVDRSSGLRRTGFQVETTDFGERLIRFAELPDAREEFLRSDLGRARIAAVLAMDLVALSRI